MSTLSSSVQISMALSNSSGPECNSRLTLLTFRNLTAITLIRPRLRTEDLATPVLPNFYDSGDSKSNNSNWLRSAKRERFEAGVEPLIRMDCREAAAKSNLIPAFASDSEAHEVCVRKNNSGAQLAARHGRGRNGRPG